MALSLIELCKSRSPGGLLWLGCLLLPLTAIVLLSGCESEPQTIEIDDRFSFNVAVVPHWYPREEEILTPSQLETIDKFGPPQFMRFWWRADGSFISSADLSGRDQKEIADEFARMRMTWVYLDQMDMYVASSDMEMDFNSDGSVTRNPLTQKLKLICLYGDPTWKSPTTTDDRGHERETWTWMDRGIIIDLSDGEIMRRRNFTGTGEGTWGLR